MKRAREEPSTAVEQSRRESKRVHGAYGTKRSREEEIFVSNKRAKIYTLECRNQEMEQMIETLVKKVRCLEYMLALARQNETRQLNNALMAY